MTVYFSISPPCLHEYKAEAGIVFCKWCGQPPEKRGLRDRMLDATHRLR